MSIGAIANLAGGYLQSVISPALQSAGLTSTSSKGASAAGAPQPDSGRLSPFAELLNTLQKLQQSNPAQYRQATHQISTNLQTAGQTAEANGNTNAGNELNTLAADFKNASQNGQLPDVQDLANAIGGGQHRHMHAATAVADGATSSCGGASEASPLLNQIFASFQSNGSENASTNPQSIILNTLASAGITGVNG